jgi:thioredoxin-related protein
MQVVALYSRMKPIAAFGNRVLRRKVIEVAEIVKENWKTLWVRLEDGKIIKRHRGKHNVVCMSEELAKKFKKEPVNVETV